MAETQFTTELNRERAAGYMTVILVTEDEAILMFVKKHGRKPEEVNEFKGKSGREIGWFLGPVTEGGE